METKAPKDRIISKLDELIALLTTCQNHEGIEYLRKKKTLLVRTLYIYCHNNYINYTLLP